MHFSWVAATKRSAISLLEVVLALAILAMASAYLAQAMSLATTNALKAERLTQAELVAESVMNQVIAGVIPAQPVDWTPYYSSTQVNLGQTSRWMYKLQSVPTELEGMLGVQIAVQEVSTDGLVRTDYDLFANRWIIDPALGLDVPPEETEDDMATGSSDSSSSSAAPSTGGSPAAGAAGPVGGAAGFGGAGPAAGGAGGRGGPPGGGGGRGGGAGGPGGGGRGGGGPGGGAGGGGRGGPPGGDGGRPGGGGRPTGS